MSKYTKHIIDLIHHTLFELVEQAVVEYMDDNAESFKECMKCGINTCVERAICISYTIHERLQGEYDGQ